MCDCDCEKRKQDKWAEIRAEALSGDQLILDGQALSIRDSWRTQGPTPDGRERWGVVTQREVGES